MSIPSLIEGNLQALCDVLGATDGGLTGAQIGQLLRRCEISDVDAGSNKRSRLFNALVTRQRQDRCGNNVAAFIQAAMAPALYVNDHSAFQDRRASLNRVLAFSALALGEDGQLHSATPAHTISEANQRAGRLRAELERRRVHPDVLRFCRAELLEENAFHAVLEATKSVADKIRRMTGLGTDGAPMVDEAFGRGSGGIPMLAFNTLRTDTESSEHTGLMNLMKGMFGAFRNPTAHGPRISWTITEEDALDLFALTSLLHRRLDKAVSTRPPNPSK